MSRRPATVAFAIGIVLWGVTAALSGRREAWDSPLYWWAAFPLTIAAAGVMGYRVPDRPWRWALVMMLAQATALAVSSADLSLLPLGLVVFALLAVPAVAAATLGAWVRRRQR